MTCCFQSVVALHEIVAASPALADVQAAVDAAVNGDIVRVPAGAATWNDSLNIINKTIFLTGAGSGVSGTVINYGGHSLIMIDAGTQIGHMSVSGFRFVGGDANNWSGTAINFSGAIGWKNFRIHHNVFDNNLQYSLRGSAATCGLIDNNIFQGSAHGIELSGNGNIDWTTALVLGTDGFFFIEGNTFNWDDWYGSTGAITVDFYNGGRVVFRNNTCRNALFETHDRARDGFPSANAWEIYNNTFTCDSNHWKGLDITAGTGVIWGNTFTGDWSVPIGAMDYKTFDSRSIPPCDGNDPDDQNVPGETGWRCQYQIGSQNWGANAVGYPAYIWSNTKNGVAEGMYCTSGAIHVVDGRDFINNGTTSKSGYTPFMYPHPLQLL